MKTFAELIRRYSEVEGVPFSELATVLNLPLPADPARDKGYAGRLMERVAEKAPDTASKADLADFDIEVKTVPIQLEMKPREPTKITSLNPSTLVSEEWFTSHVYRKIRVMLFVPVVKGDLLHPAQWYVRHPFVWLPPAEDLLQLQEDWEAIRTLVASKGPQALSSKTSAPGVHLMTKTSHQGKGRDKKRYAFWFRLPYVERVIKANIGYDALRRR